ncbi:hypothetical protein SLEP1_g49290 [Rubroshorea leprosula]|uniref:Disease resistance RPP13-like protein 1 n=1 Tax=Rubroshorea leprosula TaxID=152421 RepID=A0AAV5LWD8_9ROSI|nr:hypothetical protein SLEP1_g49290 [Rubroshorea leprosula]
MEVLSFVGSSLLSTTYDMLLEKLKGYLSDQLWNSNKEVHAQIESWKTLLLKIIAVLQHAEENQVANQFVKSCLNDLRDLAYDMEYILEEFVIDAKRSKLIAESKARANKRQKFTSSIMNLFRSKPKPNQEINSMGNQLNDRLKQIEKEIHTLGLINLTVKAKDESHKVDSERLLESSLLEDKLWGRDSEKEAIIDLLKDGSSCLEQGFVIPIVGMGGVGKTTLARLIYNDEKLKGWFDLKAWVCVSDEFDVAQITRTILEHEYGQWDVLKRPFISGAPGSKIIVTTRNKDVGTMMRGDDGVYNLELLQDNACLPLFTWHALGKKNFDVHPDLQDVGEKLVKRCKRLPLALKTLGSILRGKLRRDEWENILNSEIWTLSEDRSGILPTLRLSYNHLPSHLKQCFAYCALFPKDYEFDEKELILLWMAEGLLQQQSQGKKQMEEEIGHRYFQELLARSLFQQSSKDESRFVMHDLINDLVVDVAREIYCNLEHSMGDGKLEKARHFYRISKLPVDSFANLKHIRYINLSGTKIKCIPESVGFLLFLQTLLLHGCHKLTKLPATIGNLIDLHHLDIIDTESLEEMPSEICNLKNLVTLSKVIVGKTSGLMRLSDLKNFSQLRGRLSLLDLQNVLDVQDAREANLDKIHGLEELLLKWTSSDNDRNDLVLEMQVLHWLKPHSNLKSLKIFCYGDKNFPNWVSDPLLFFNLSSMVLSNCKRCTLLPSLGILPLLKDLIIEGMEAIEAIGFEFYGGHGSFPSLAELVFKNMLNWKEWTSPARSVGEFPCLHKLVIDNCPQLLGQLPINLSSVKELDVRRCNVMLLKSMGDLTLLSNLRVEKILELTYLPKSFTQSLTTLETLYIGHCNDLAYLWEEGTEIEQSLLPFNLKHLSLKHCGALVSLPNAMMMRMDGSNSSDTSMLMLRLEKLEISGCHSLNSFPRGKLPSMLTYLKIEDCECLKSLPKANGDDNSNLHLEIKNLPCLYSSQDSHQLPAYLKKFTVDDGGEWLESFPERILQHCTRLQSIEIGNCKILKSLPTLDCVSHLLRLFIYRCEVLESLPEELGSCTPNLKDLSIEWCENFKSLPSTMYQLKSLQSLLMFGCPGIEFILDGGLPPNLTELHLEKCVNLKYVPNTMYQLTSLQSLRISGGALTMGLQNLTSLQWLKIEQKFPLDIALPSSLTSLWIIDEENLKSIPGGLFQNLSSFEMLWISNCQNLRSLPREVFHPSLVGINIFECPHLKRQRFEAKGDYWALTQSIARVEIDGEEIISKGMSVWPWPWHYGNSQPPISLQKDALRQANQFQV